jgi:prepilin-type processing-associated H-X9-DG protein
MTAKPDVATLVRELRATLDHIGDALVSGRYDDLISTESRLAGVVSGFAVAFADGHVDRPLAAELDDALTALRRCQKLGTTFTDLGETWLNVGHPHAGAYDRSGRSHGHTSAMTLETRA